MNYFILFFYLIHCCDCAITIIGQHKSYTDPDLKYSQFPIVLQADTPIKCDHSVSIARNWQAFSVDESNGWEISTLNLERFSPFKNQLMIEPYFLTPGLYKFSFNIISNTIACSVNDVQSTYIKIEPSDLIVVLVPGPFPKTLINAITVVPNDTVTLQPGSFSFYPHLSTSDSFNYVNIKYYCRQLHEKYPNDLNAITVGPDGSSTLPGKGCFNQGPGRLNLHGGTVSFDASKLSAGYNYELRADVYVSDENFYSGRIHIRLIDDVGNSPVLKISPHKPNLAYETGTTLKISVHDKLILKSFCNNNNPCYDLPNVQFLWTIFYYGLDYKPVIYKDIASYSVGQTAYQFTIFNDFFLAQRGQMQFGITLQMNSTGNPTVESSIYIELNSPPMAGNCSVTPTVGSVLSKFILSCSDWVDDEGVHAYIFYKNDSGRHDIAVTCWDIALSIYLPLGSENNGFSYILWVDIVDNYGATVTKSLGLVTINPVSCNTSYYTIQHMLNDIRVSENSLESITLTSAYLSLANYQLTNNFSLMEGISCIFNTETTNCLSVWNFDCDLLPDRSMKELYTRLDFLLILLLLKLNSVSLWFLLRGNTVRSQLVRNVLDSVSSVMPYSIGTSLSLIRQLTVDGFGQDITMDTMDTLTNVFSSIKNNFDKSAYSTSPYNNRKTVEQIVMAVGHSLKSLTTSLLSPVAYDQSMARDFLYHDYDGSLPKNTDDIKYWETTNVEEIGVKAAKVYYNIRGKKFANTIVQLLNLIRSNLINDITPDEPAYHFEHGGSGVEMILNVQNVNIFERSQKMNGTNFKIILPELFNLVSDAHSLKDIALFIIHFDGNVFKFADENRLLTSGSTDIELLNFRSNTKISVTNSNTPIELFQNLHNSSSLDSINTITPILSVGSIMKYHSVTVNVPKTVIIISLNRTNEMARLKIFIQLGVIPGPSSDEYLFSETIEPYTGAYHLKIDEDKLGAFVGTVYIGIAQLNDNDPDVQMQNNNYDYQFQTNYTLQFNMISCNYFDDSLSRWSFEGCRMGPLTTLKESHCLCNHLTSFASGLIIPPNTIDFDYVFSHADYSKNITIYMTIFIIFCAYFLTILYARRADRGDIIKLGVSPLVDNDKLDKYYYEIIVSTGMHRDSATDSNVYFILDGEKERTSVRILSTSGRPAFRRGQVNRFIMAVPKSLGHLNLLRIWHDNSGKGMFASWFLNYVIFIDLQTHTKYFFLADKWLSVEKDDFQIERSIPAATQQKIYEFKTLFSGHWKRIFADNHLWLSIFLRPSNNRFTRCQRTTSCLVLLFTFMLVSAVWYSKTKDAPLSHYLSLGFLKISLEEIGVGLFSNLIVFPINFFIVLLFRYSRQREPYLFNVMPKMTNNKTYSGSESPPVSLDEISNPNFVMKNLGGIYPVSAMPDSEYRRKLMKCLLPWWFRIFAWALCLIIVLICCFFLSAYAVQFSDMKTQKWLITLFVSIIASVFLIQPLKIIVMVFFFSCLCKKDLSEEDDQELYVLEHDERYAPNKLPKIVPYYRCDDKRIDKSREWRMNELKLYDVLREISLYGFFLLVVMVVANRDPLIPVYRQHMTNMFATGQKISMGNLETYSQINTVDDFWSWTITVLIPNIRSPRWYNGQIPFGQRGFFADRTSRILGYATIRQIRTTNECSIQSPMKTIVDVCYGQSSLIHEDKENYTVQWQQMKSADDRPVSGYTYRSSEELNTVSFAGQGELTPRGGSLLTLLLNNESPDSDGQLPPTNDHKPYKILKSSINVL